MRIRPVPALLALGLVAAACLPAAAQKPAATMDAAVATGPGKAVLAETVKTSATIVSIDSATRGITLKRQDGKDLLVMGSGELVQSLQQHGLVDEFLLLIHPLVLGSGRRLFKNDGVHAPLCLINCVTTTTGVLMASYRPAVPTA